MILRALQHMTISETKGRIGGGYLERGTIVMALDRMIVDFGHSEAENIFVLAGNGKMYYCYFSNEHWEQL